MGQAKRIEQEKQRKEAEDEAKKDHVAVAKGFVCDRCQAPIPHEGWGIQKLCSYCQQILSNS
jgi:hypothetical protein